VTRVRLHEERLSAHVLTLQRDVLATGLNKVASHTRKGGAKSPQTLGELCVLGKETAVARVVPASADPMTDHSAIVRPFRHSLGRSSRRSESGCGVRDCHIQLRGPALPGDEAVVGG
jgi:hypothetical protein